MATKGRREKKSRRKVFMAGLRKFQEASLAS
jgi:hypothetical protein